MPAPKVAGSGGAQYRQRGAYVQENFDLGLRSLRIGDSKSWHEYCHAVGSSSHKSPSKYGSWIKLWETERGITRSKCMFYQCNQDAVLGVHVRKASSDANDAYWYIVPACSDCNNIHKKFAFNAKMGPKSHLKKDHRKIKVAGNTQGRLNEPGWLYPGSRWQPKEKRTS
jgi:hypothetical protein